MAGKQLTPEEKEKQRERLRLWYLSHREEVIAKTRARHLAKREEILKRRREKRLANPEISKTKNAEYRAANREKLAAKGREYHAANREREIAKKRIWNLVNQEELREKCRKYSKTHPVEALSRARNARARQRAAHGAHTPGDIAGLFESQRGRCAACHVALIERGKGKYHIDHVMPLIRGGSNDVSNLQLLCPFCNLSKKDKHPDDWARSRGRLFA
jgi:5-methylcytosine-specific restriction endonuclease McrA